MFGKILKKLKKFKKQLKKQTTKEEDKKPLSHQEQVYKDKNAQDKS